jgi:hypothetical protein
MTFVSSDPIRRTTARVLPVNRDGDVLLLRGCDPQRPDELAGADLPDVARLAVEAVAG